MEEIFKELKAMSKYIKEGENMSLKNNTLFGEWLSNAGRRYKYIKKEYLLQRFGKWVYKECGIKKQTIYNYINLYKLMCLAPNLLGCRVNMTMKYDYYNYESLMTYFGNKGQISWNF